MLQVDNGSRDAHNNSFATLLGASAVAEFRSGPPPVNAAAGDTGTLLVSMNLPAAPFNASAAGVMTFNGTWQALASASGAIGHFRLKSGGVTTRMQGICAQLWTASTPVILGQQASNGGLTYRCTTAGITANAGGPTGTGVGIVDGTVVWSYVGTTDMLIDNTITAVNQQLTVQQFTLTADAGNA